MKTPGRKKARIGLTALVVVAVLVTAGVVWADRQTADTDSVTAVFADASPLVPGNEVRLYGVKVGTIGSITLAGGHANVELKLDKGAPALHQDAKAVIRPVSLLGERYVDLDAGTDSAPYLSGTKVIPADRTSAAVDLDQVLNSLDDPTSTALAALVTTLGEGLDGRGADASAALKALAPAMEQTGQLSDILDQQNQVLTQLIDSAHGTVGALADNGGGSMNQLVSTAQQTLSTVATNRAALDSALQELPGTLEKARRTLANFAGVTDDTAPVLQDIKPVTDDLSNVTAELRSFADAADPALGSLPQVLDKLNGMLDQARPVVDALVPASADLHTAATAAAPIGATLLNHAPGTPSHLENLLTGAANWGMATSGYDGLSHYFRGVVGVTPETIRNLVAGALPALGPLDQGNRPVDPNTPGQQPATPLVPQLGPVPSLGLPSLGGTPPPPADPSNATGLAPQQEQSLLDQLLGGS